VSDAKEAAWAGRFQAGPARIVTGIACRLHGRRCAARLPVVITSGRRAAPAGVELPRSEHGRRPLRRLVQCGCGSPGTLAADVPPRTTGGLKA
jgi:hypothetical protein